MKRWQWYLLPTVLYALPLLVARALWGQAGSWEAGVYMFRLRPMSWLSRTWGRRWNGCCLGHTIMLDHDASGRTVRHELVHVDQYDATGGAGMITAILLGVLDHPFLALAAWTLAPAISYAGGSWAALYDDRDPYRANYYERTARLFSNDQRSCLREDHDEATRSDRP